ncbi:zinc-regulated transporter 1 [Colletotrichum higginsianum]|uniref:Zinc-regulated transporter 1 n=2 Tax=Colletotrichum higginsianum TaxID=80884 RepID=H1VUR7_COLHI|nr:Zinc-regulated transporter 1 [Colletotrichum higginsianum IMI 349063]OBR11318.1 Zinc-regulated transporter 1 [Colletotrichum higginsianum IMI 349063]TIC99910.1 Zinc-regulated transporter 1 [Colletotrichum higginsianum]CCF43976.1 zinc-regulated transporter 1 [Colletotrichum higginsianum]
MTSSIGPIVNLTQVSQADVICYYALSGNDYNGHLGARISSIFVILFVSTAFTVFPIASKRLKTLKIPRSAYTFARYFGSGVILATAFIHLLEPAYKRIGPRTCIGESGHWGDYSWCAAIVLASALGIFSLDLAAEVYVERKYGQDRNENAVEALVSGIPPDGLQQADDSPESTREKQTENCNDKKSSSSIESGQSVERSFRQQIAAFLILEFGIIVHSVIIGLNLGVTGSEFATLYPVLVFHQSFEGLGIGARMSSIPFGKHTWLPWILCAAYGLTTPVSIAIGLGVRTTYVPKSKQALMVQGILNAISAGLLIYSSLVELLARDFLFDPSRSRRRSQIMYMFSCMVLGAGIMSLIGFWA